ncbi:MAG: quercetin 2,3-dioxygenase [Rhodobacterales bacterium CG18_big_fil_WC_8_21_14_2_50_71_9]|nr:MAG: quercetin 2,3-dioxygenase [Rhodobacterales bacterium CG18_big_fil_WC_8_21_14_2_50_71_9]PJA60189.1 MAG: quercetin 2,3-dioxygenase [Rhodobacterales bacterium CG_4_9_14_3_um_filter_71_31]
MIDILRADDRFHTRIGWLDSRHSFSFGEHHDPARMGFGALRVINEDVIAGGGGFAPHGHRDMEIITWVLDGALAHRDSTGGEGVIRPGAVQKMSAGRGVRHSEINASDTAPVHLLQIWLAPDARGAAPKYEEAAVPDGAGLRLIAARAGAPVSLLADARLYAGRFSAAETAQAPLAAGRRAWVQVARGGLSVNGVALGAGDGAALTGEQTLSLRAGADGAEALLFDLA